MQHLHGVVQSKNVLVPLYHIMHLFPLGGAAKQCSCQQRFTCSNSVVLWLGVCEDQAGCDRAWDFLSSGWINKSPRLQGIPEPGARPDVLLGEGVLSVLIQSDHLNISLIRSKVTSRAEVYSIMLYAAYFALLLIAEQA